MLSYLALIAWVVSLVSGGAVEVPNCPHPWISTNSGRSCVMVVKDHKATWEKARSVCQNEGADLIQIRDQDTNDFVKGKLTGGQRYWIGVAKNDGRFELFSYGRPAVFLPWAAGEPNNRGGNERCVEIIGNTRGAWNDKRCSKKRGYICERVIGIPG